MKKFLKIVGIIILVLVLLAAAAASYVKTALPNVGEAPVITVERTPERIERGKYLANHVTICMDCHSTRDWSLFSGPLAPGNLGGGGEAFSRDLGFPGAFYARNITPYGIGTWTDGEVFRAITTGQNKHGEALFPIMPYLNYGQLDEEDIYSIIAYIRTLAPVQHDVTPREADFPVNILINTMPMKANLSKRPAETDLVAYGKYVITAASCVECHSKREKGTKVPGTEYGGGMEFIMPNGIVRSANITPDMETGIGSWTEEAFLKRFKAYADSSYKPHKVGPKEMNSAMPWMMYAGMKEGDLKAIFAYLKTVTPIRQKVVKFEFK
ncbi:c-type cytochrome [Dyadobacter sp. MSC1_007]|jgi:mono/diheme cytochrome c family protein|uniref:c-type cytochrome n=1 Tax=Dyadobacter sp. MSC1_007 TaxID=2909264 RepID=UPI00202FB19A|nr:c-type cytochrome [Dyadobacter sp. MSC1_007]